MVAPDEWALFSGLVLIGLGVLGGVGAYVHEKREWNRGACRACGAAWVYFATDSQKGLGFKCGCGRACWVSYRRVLRA